jgi:hypothetical protein
MNEPLTIPSVNIFNDPNVLQTLWNYLGSTFTLGAAPLLIVVALILIPSIWNLLIDSIHHASAKEGRESRRDHDDDDDW